MLFKIVSVKRYKRPKKYSGFAFFISVVTGIILFPTISPAQDANYWTHQYGSRSTLLGGAVIGSVLDLSGTYYNPGAISLIKDPESILAAKVFEYPTYTLSGSFFNDVKISSSSIGPAPSLVATMLKFDWLGNHNLALSLLTRFDFRLDLSESLAYPFRADEIDEAIVNLRLNERMIETWFGVTWSYKFGPKVGIGATPYVVFRSQNMFGQTIIQFLSPQDDLFFALDTKEYDYDHFSLLLKAGITFDFIGHTFGLTITTPRIGFYDYGFSGTNNTVNGVDSLGNNQDQTFVAADYQKDVSANYKSPFSTAIGTTFKIDRTNLYISAEWFSAIEKYDVITPRSYQAQIGADTLYNGVTSESKSVINVGIGLQHTINESFSVNISFTTDYSANVPDSDTNLSFASWDIYHLMFGGSFKVLDSEFTLGLGYSFGSDKVRKSFIADPEPAVTSLSVSSFEGAEFKYQTFKFVFGFSF
jgi:hypothetical protein